MDDVNDPKEPEMQADPGECNLVNAKHVPRNTQEGAFL